MNCEKNFVFIVKKECFSCSHSLFFSHLVRRWWKLLTLKWMSGWTPEIIPRPGPRLLRWSPRPSLNNKKPGHSAPPMTRSGSAAARTGWQSTSPRPVAKEGRCAATSAGSSPVRCSPDSPMPSSSNTRSARWTAGTWGSAALNGPRRGPSRWARQEIIIFLMYKFCCFMPETAKKILFVKLQFFSDNIICFWRWVMRMSNVLYYY